ncbi:hypothetical protein [Roseomonas chloroacetimidivorans]|uniref:hypothetical protein n=1 Tax=Roseomonas chloroacetimidivorans TaxID=1766656 RepID=UPI003C72F143
MPDALGRRGLDRLARRCAGPWWCDYLSVRLPRRNLGVDVFPMDRAISGERYDRTIDLVKHGADQQTIVEIVAGQNERGGRAGVVIRGRISGHRARTTLSC